jgi:hypothetical protein
MIKQIYKKAPASHIVLGKVTTILMAALMALQLMRSRLCLSKRYFVILMAISLALPLIALSGCGQSATVKESSPRFVSADIVAAGDGTEAGQRLELRLRFSAAVAPSATDAALSDFAIILNNKEVDKNAIAVALAQDNADAEVLLITFTPAKGAGGPSSAHYFALYDGALSISARDTNGALPHVTAAADKTVCAELTDAVNLQVPSGLRITNQGEIKGSAADNTKASCVFRVMAVPNIRVMAFLELSPGSERIKLHNHEFYNYTDANRDEFAALLAEEIKTLLGDEYLVVPSADSVTIAHNKLVDGEELLPRVIEGVAGSA